MHTRHHRGRTLLAGLATLALGVAACSADDSSARESAPATLAPTEPATTVAPSTAPAPTAEPGPTTVAADPAPACTQGATQADVLSTMVGESWTDLDVTSFDGTIIRAHWFPVGGEAAAPTVLMGPGFGSAGDESVGPQDPTSGQPGITTLNDAGYNVLTWDPRGFGESGGVVSLDSPELEGRDTQVLLDWVAQQPEAQLDAPGDPRVGMVGGSYGGGIQLTVASIDCRVEAIVPGIAWHSLVSSLFPADTMKAGWTGLLDAVSSGGRRDERIETAMASRAAGVLAPEIVDWYASRGVGDAIDRVTTPTMFLQGTVDTLFPLDEATVNYESLRDRGVPARLMWFCGGHGVCLTNTDDAARVRTATLAWLQRYVQDDDAVDTGPAFDIVDDEGAVWTGDDVPAPAAYLEATADDGLDLSADGGSGPARVPPTVADPLGQFVAAITAAPATNAVTADVLAPEASLVVGAPKLSLTYFGTAGPGDGPTRVFAQIVDVGRGAVVGNQVTPIELVLDEASHTVEIDMETIGHSMEAGETLQLQLTPTAVEFSTPRLGGHVEFTSVGIRLPVVASLTPA